MTWLVELLTSASAFSVAACVHVDLRPLWNWNTQQLFVYVSAEWQSETQVRVGGDAPCMVLLSR